MKRKLIERYCLTDDLSTYDIYDMWKTSIGFHVKDFYNCHRKFGTVVAAPLSIFDMFINNRLRMFYQKQEYPIVRALAALSLINLYEENRQSKYMDYAGRHLSWLLRNSCTGYSGYCWGLNFRYAVGCRLVYHENTPFSTMTPYPLEAFVRYSELTGDERYDTVIRSILDFYLRDIEIMEETDSFMATSYVPMRDRVVVNAASYTMYSYCLTLPYSSPDTREQISSRIQKLYNFIKLQQREDGSWFYSPEGGSFIDCFHTCIVLKNIYKSARLTRLEGAEKIVEKGYGYVKDKLFDDKKNLFRRFSVRNKPSLVEFDLYDNAEALNLAILLNDTALIARLAASIQKNFCFNSDIYSQIDLFGIKRSKNMLRWAIMPYIYALSQS